MEHLWIIDPLSLPKVGYCHMADSSFPPKPSHEDILAFMDDDERQYWDSPLGGSKGTLTARGGFWKELESLWLSIPDPTPDELRQLMGETNWDHVQRGENAEGIVNFYRRKWKRDRKTDALSRRKQSTKAEPASPKRGMEREQQKLEAEVVESMHPEDRKRYDDPDTSEERRTAIFETYKDGLEERKRREEAAFRKDLDRTTKAQDLLHRIKNDSSKSDLPLPANDSKEALLKWYDEMSKPVRPIPFAGDAVISEPPETKAVSLSLDDTLQKPKLLTLELADNAGALQDVEGRPESNMAVGTQERPTIQKAESSLPEKFWKFTDSNLLWGGGIGLAFIAYAFEWANVPPRVTLAMLAVAWLIISVSIWRHRFFERWPPSFEMVVNGFISLLVAVLIVIGWIVFQPSPTLPKTMVDASGDTKKNNEVEPRVFIDVQPAFLMSLFKKYNTIQAEEITKPYIGKWMQFSGVVTNVTRNVHDKSETATMSIRPDPYETENSYVVEAEFSDQRWIVRSSVMQRGEKVTVIGKIDQVIEPGIILRNSEIIEGR